MPIKLIPIKKIVRERKETPVYDIEVADHHSFTITKQNIAVHNSACTTRVVTGHGIPQATAIMNIRAALPNITIIADGGIKTSGDIVKAIGLGANAVMLGRLLAGATETPIKDGKIYRGQSSAAIHTLYNKSKAGITPEGVQYSVTPIGPVSNIIDDLIGGLRSGMTYSGAYSIELLHQKAQFIEVGHHGYIEGTPHGKSN